MVAVSKLRLKLMRGSRLTASEVRKLLRLLGYELARQKGSHEQWVRESRTFTLACHGKDVPQYILDALRSLLEERDGQRT